MQKAIRTSLALGALLTVTAGVGIAHSMFAAPAGLAPTSPALLPSLALASDADNAWTSLYSFQDNIRGCEIVSLDNPAAADFLILIRQFIPTDPYFADLTAPLYPASGTLQLSALGTKLDFPAVDMGGTLAISVPKAFLLPNVPITFDFTVYGDSDDVEPLTHTATVQVGP